MRSIGDDYVLIAHDAKSTSVKAAKKAMPKSGTMRYLIYETVKNYGGLADFELENILRGKHHSISAGRRSLVIDGFLVDTGLTRKNESGNECAVWKISSHLQGELFLGKSGFGGSK